MAAKTIEQNDIEKRLLEEGARSYLDAITAIFAFEEMVQKKCRDLLSRRLASYTKALRINPPLASTEIRGYVWPESATEFNGRWRSVGVVLGREIPGVRWWGTYCSLDWEANDNYFGVGISKYIAPRSVAESIYSKFHARNPGGEWWAAGTEFGLCRQIKVEHAGDFEERLDALLEEWIELWRKIGGIKTALKP